jgi:dihydrofolate synthase/folylpolyglutamate synthase
LEVYGVAHRIAEEKGADLTLSEGRVSSGLDAIGREKGWPTFLLENAAVATEVLELLDIPYRIDDLKTLELFGRFYPFRKNIRIDVGHNPLAARAIVQALRESVVLIYNSLDDKDYEAVLKILQPKIKRVALLPIATQRAATLTMIRGVLERLAIPCEIFDGTIEEGEQYLVFGSFYTVEAFIKRMGEETNGSE